MRVIHGMSEVAGQGIYTVMGLRQNGVDASMAVWSANSFGYQSDIDLHIDKTKKYMFPVYALKMGAFAMNAVKKYDILHSHFGESLLSYNMDVNMLKRKNKKIFTEFHGSDIRNIFNEVSYKYINFEKAKKEREQAVIARLIDIRKAQQEYRSLHHGMYTEHFDTLIDFVKNQKLPFVMKVGQLTDKQLEDGLTEKKAMAIINKAQKTGKYDEVKKWGLENFKRDTMWVAVMDTVYPKV